VENFSWGVWKVLDFLFVKEWEPCLWYLCCIAGKLGTWGRSECLVGSPSAASSVRSQLWVWCSFIHVVKTQLPECGVRLQSWQHQPASRGWRECLCQHRQLCWALRERIYCEFIVCHIRSVAI